MARVLIVDDEESIRISLGAFATKDGHTVSLAGDAFEALDLLAKEPFDVVVTDIILPRKSGVVLLGDIREAQPDVQVIMMTGEPEVGTAAEAVRQGAFDYLSKPVSRDAISRVLAGAVAKKALLDENRSLEEENRKHREHLEQLVEERTEQLRNSATRYRTLFSSIADPVFVFNQETSHFLDCNQSALDLYGYTMDELNAMTPRDLHLPEEREQVESNIADAEDMSAKYYTHVTKNGEEFPVEVHTNGLEYQGEEAWISIVRDITERKKAEERTKRLLDQQVAINELSLALGEKRDLDSIYHTIYEHVSRMMDAEAFVVSFYEGETNLIRARYVLHEGQELDVESFPPIPLEEKGHGTQSQVIRTGKPVYFPDYDMARMRIEPKIAYDVTVSDGASPTVQATRGERRSSSNKSVLYVPMKIEGEVIGVMQVQSARLDAYTEEDMALLGGLANVTTVAIENSRLLQEIHDALAGTVHIVSDTVEIRDPYTAGHQRRVTRLACAVGTKLGFPEERIDGLRVAGLLHDLGKMSIPAEILSKPTRLTEIEFALIQSHPQVAYDLLKSIHFPWPIAEIVLQHHERMDGSGYPHGLKGEEILSEATILAVCDVVEAMAAHRPYRAALGVDAALEAITKNKGELYSEDVVDACLQLFANGEFSFEEQL